MYIVQTQCRARHSALQTVYTLATFSDFSDNVVLYTVSKRREYGFVGTISAARANFVVPPASRVGFARFLSGPAANRAPANPFSIDRPRASETSVSIRARFRARAPLCKLRTYDCSPTRFARFRRTAVSRACIRTRDERVTRRRICGGVLKIIRR